LIPSHCSSLRNQPSRTPILPHFVHLPQSQLPSLEFQLPILDSKRTSLGNPAAGSKLPAKCCNNTNPCLEACPNIKLRGTKHEGDTDTDMARGPFPSSSPFPWGGFPSQPGTIRQSRAERGEQGSYNKQKSGGSQ